MKKKYEFSKETLEIDGHILHRIIALKDFNIVKKGDLGGFIEEEDNLSQYGECWIYDNAAVYDGAIVYGDAMICNKARIFDNAEVGDNVVICNNVLVYGYATICDNAKIFGNVKIYDFATIGNNAYIYSDVKIYNHAKVYGNTIIWDKVRIFDYAVVCDNAKINDSAEICDKAVVCGNVEIKGNAIIRNNKSDYIIFKNWWSSGRFFTWTRSNDMWSVGCFYGTGEELVKKAYNDSEEKGHEYEKVVKYIESIKPKLK